jgi:tetratricopeptide (TPR) repeat protein
MNPIAEAAIAKARELGAQGQLLAAETALREAMTAADASPELHYELAQVLAGQGGDASAVMAALREALERDPGFAPAVHSLGYGLLESGEAEEALALARPLAEASPPDAGALSIMGQALLALGRTEEGLDALETAAAQRSDLIHQHILAAALQQAGLNPEATRAARAARAQGFDSAETWLVEGQSLLGQDRLDEAEAAFREALRRRPDYAMAHRELGQLVWARTGDVAEATREVEKAIAAHPQASGLRVVRAKTLEYAGDAPGAYDALRQAIEARGPSLDIELAASQAAIGFDASAALEHALNAERMAPGDLLAISVLAEANLAAGRPEDALRAAERLRALAPANQHALALEATAWRILGDPRYAERSDYGSLVRTFRIETPEGWSSLADYLAALTAGLDRLHVMKAHPIGQSLRGGAQTNQNLQRSINPAIRAFFRAIHGPICQAMDEMGPGEDPLRARNTGRYKVAGAWSVNLQPGGRHVDHLHPAGWLSSAFYVDVPRAVEGEGREGWLRFGQPGIPTQPGLEAEHWVKPEAGTLVLFPSYMWHGTVPFGGEHRRLTVAFDVSPS